MPIYEYECGSCEGSFELLVIKRDQADDQVCPLCGSKEVRRKMSSFSSPGIGSSCGSCSSKSSSCTST
jgi:putative FmdB family regulatory protein